MRIAKSYTGSNPARTLIFVHGYTGDASTWDNWLTILQSTKFPHNAHVVEYDSTRNPVEHWADQLSQLLANLPNQLPLILIGHSMGAPVIRSAWLRSPNQWWTNPTQHDFIFLAPADTGAKKLLEMQGRPTGFFARSLQALNTAAQLFHFNDDAYRDLSGQTDFLARLQLEASRFKPALGVFIADADIVVNTRPYRPQDPLRIIPYTNHSTITKCHSPHSDIFREFDQLLTNPQPAKTLETASVWDRLRRVFYERSGAAAAASLLVSGDLYFSAGLDQAKRDLMRFADAARPVNLLGEQSSRDLLDRLVEFFALSEIAIACGLISPQQIATILPERIPTDPIFSDYFTTTYPVELATRFARRTMAQAPTCTVPPEDFNRFLDNTEAISGNSNIQFFFRLLDYYYYGDFSLESFLNSLESKSSIPQRHVDMQHRAIAGLGDYVEALSDLQELIENLAPGFQELTLRFHSYWLRKLAPLAPRLRQIILRIQGPERLSLLATLDTLDRLLASHQALP